MRSHLHQDVSHTSFGELAQSLERLVRPTDQLDCVTSPSVLDSGGAHLFEPGLHLARIDHVRYPHIRMPPCAFNLDLSRG